MSKVPNITDLPAAPSKTKMVVAGVVITTVIVASVFVIKNKLAPSAEIIEIVTD